MDYPVLDEMARARDVRDGSLQKWLREIRVILADKDAQIAALEAQLAGKKGRAA